MKPCLGVDFDDTAVDTTAVRRVWYHDRYGVDVPYEAHTTTRYCELWGCTYQESVERCLEFERECAHSLQPFEGAAEALCAIAREYNPHIISAREEEFHPHTDMVTSAHFPQVFCGIHLCSYWQISAAARPKWQICRQLNIPVMLEDSANSTCDLVTHGIRVILFDRPWNRDLKKHRLVTRVEVWPEAEEILIRKPHLLGITL